jgi:hypothetical protein
MVVGRLLTNRHIREHWAEISAAGTPVGRIPAWFSVTYLVGLCGLIGAGVWAFVSIGWWAAAIVVGMYFVTGFVRSELSVRR